MKKFSLLLLDADVVICLFERGIWDSVVEKCDVHLTPIVKGECKFFYDSGGRKRRIDLDSYKRDQRITVHNDISLSQLNGLVSHFGPDFLERLHDGERESLALLVNGPHDEQSFMICSCDKIVFRILGALRISDRGLSLEEILRQIGLGRELERQFTKKYRLEWTEKGFGEGICGFGVK